MLLLLLAGCGAPAAVVDDSSTPSIDPRPVLPLADPTAKGPLTWTTRDYDLGKMMVGGRSAKHADYEYEALIRGTITLPEGDGPFPLAVFLHGQHSPCSDGGDREGNDCTKPYRNDRGYLYLMEHLASHGVATASILAFEINRRNGAGDIGMWARGELVLGTIDALQTSEYAARLDFSRIGLMGHSRGGEGVVTAIEVNNNRSDPHALRAVIALAPTDFAYRKAPGVAFLTLAPYCDGDVYSLHGLRQFDQSRFTDFMAVKVQLLVMGANHNNYNTQWGRAMGIGKDDGDDAGFGSHQNTHCDLTREEGGGRLTLEETYAEAILHLGGFLRWNLLGEEGLAAYFLGAPQPPETCPAKVACPGATHLSTMAPGRRDLFWVESGGVVTAPGVSTTPAPKVCRLASCAANDYSSAWMVDIEFTERADFSIRFDAATDISATPHLNMRLAVPTDRSLNAFGPPRMTATFRDAAAAHSVSVNHPALFLPPGLVLDPGVGVVGLYPGGAKVSANAVQIPFPPRFDATSAREISFSFTGTGSDRVLLADAWLNPTATKGLAA